MDTTRLAQLLHIEDLPVHLKRVEQTLEEIVATDTAYLREPALRMIKKGGKRLRPFLVMAAVQSQNKTIDQDVIAVSAIIELVHVGTIIHDDIIDDADTRWGAPTIHKREGSDSAILVGDYLLALASTQAAKISQAMGIAVADTVVTMCEGQGQEIADSFNVNRSIKSYNQAISKKTAALTAAACRVGAMSANASNKQNEALTAYGTSFGMAFQLMDDLLDICSTTEAMGKPVGNDIKQGVYTYPVLYALKSSPNSPLASWLGDNPPKQLDQSGIIKILNESGAFDATLAEIRKHNDAAVKSLAGLDKNSVRDGLSKLPDLYLSWAKNKMLTDKLS